MLNLDSRIIAPVAEAQFFEEHHSLSVQLFPPITRDLFVIHVNMADTKYVLVFGSLRQNTKKGTNFGCCGKQEYIRDFDLEGYEMYSLGPYPSICSGQGTVKCELHSVNDQTYQKLVDFEVSAGYEETKITLSDGIVATVFTWPPKKLRSKYPRVISGEWN